MEKNNIIIRCSDYDNASIFQFKDGRWILLAEGKYDCRCFGICFQALHPESKERFHIFTTLEGKVIPVIELKEWFEILETANEYKLITRTYMMGEGGICSATRLFLKYGDSWYNWSNNDKSLNFLGRRIAVGVFYDEIAEKLEIVDYATFCKPVGIRTIGETEIEFDDINGRHHHYLYDSRVNGWRDARPWWKRFLGL